MINQKKDSVLETVSLWVPEQKSEMFRIIDGQVVCLASNIKIITNIKSHGVDKW